MIFGEEGRRFLESTKHVKKESKKRLAEMELAYQQYKAAFDRGKMLQADSHLTANLQKTSSSKPTANQSR